MSSNFLIFECPVTEQKLSGYIDATGSILSGMTVQITIDCRSSLVRTIKYRKSATSYLHDKLCAIIYESPVAPQSSDCVKV